MKNIRMCDDEIENYFDENGKLNKLFNLIDNGLTKIE